MRLRTIFCCLFPLATSLTVSAQDLDLAKLRTDIVAHSPEAEAMAKYGVLPVNLYTGMPQISVPIYEIKTPNFTLPFSLSYNYNGCKPNEVASWVGLGWSLQGGGVITRMVKGQVDENMSSNHRYYDFINPEGLSWKQSFLKDVADGTSDAQPDVYIFNVCGYSGKFVLIKGKAYITPYQNVRITPFGSGFKIIDDKGNEYQFNDYETTYHKIQSGAVTIPQHKSAWYLSLIISADKKDTVQLGYTSYSYKQPDAYMDSYTIDEHVATGFNTSGHTFTSIIYAGDHIDSKLLSYVNSKYGNLYFAPSVGNRHDVTGSTDAKYLDMITITGPSGSSLSRQIKLTHDYFGDSSRLNLKKVTLYGESSGSYGDKSDSSVYAFDYDSENTNFPANGTRSIDMYGYYNGHSNAMLFPSGAFSPALYSYADRSPNTGHMGTMTKMTYPTGGYSVFDYEQNQSGHYNVTSNYNDTTMSLPFIQYNSLNQIDGYTTEIAFFDLVAPQMVYPKASKFIDTEIDTFAILKLFHSGPIPLFTSPLIPDSLASITDSIYLPAGSYYFTVRCNQSLTKAEGSVRFKDYIVDNTLADVPGLRIKGIYSFDNIHSSDTALIKRYTYNEGTEVTGGGISFNNVHNTCSDFYVDTYQSGCKSALSDLADEQFYYKEVTEINRNSQLNGYSYHTFEAQTPYLVNVQPLSGTDYKYVNGKYLPVKRTITQYQSPSPNAFGGFDVTKIAVIGPTCSGCLGCFQIPSPDGTQAVTGLNEVYGITNTTYFVSGYTLQTQTNETQYNDAGDSAMETQTNYYYDDSDHIYPSRIVTKDSKGLTLTTTLKYPLDYTFDTCATLTSMNDAFNGDLANAMGALNTCLSSLITALAPYQPYSPNTSGNQSSFTSIANSYDCKGSFTSGTSTATTNRDNAWTSYLSCISSHITSNPTSWKKAVLWMKYNNIVSPVIEKYISIKDADSSEYLLAATRNEYVILDSQAVMPVLIRQVEPTSGLLKSSFLSNPDNYYKAQVSFGYDDKLNLVSQNKTNDLKQCYIWDYSNTYPIAQVINGDTSGIAFTSFESDGKGHFNYSGAVSSDGSSPTGKKCYNISNGNITRTGLSTGITYVITYWKKDGSGSPTVNSSSGVSIVSKNGWTLYKHEITGSSTITISGSGYIDEIRLYPKGAMMITYTYDPLIGMISQSDAANHISYYEYDGMGRLLDVRDADKNIVKKICYNLAGQPERCSLFGNVEKTAALPSLAAVLIL
jgi:YD repeat-containing protein